MMSEQDQQALRWLSEVVRNDYIAVEGAPREMPPAARSVSASLPHIGFDELLLDDEARSLTISPDGTCVAAGTKSGQLHVGWWSPQTRHWEHWSVDEALWQDSPWKKVSATPTTDPKRAPRVPERWAIRALAFLETTAERTVIAAGYADSQVAIVTFHRDPRDPDRPVDVVHAVSDQPLPPAEDRRKHARMRRFSRLIHLYNPTKSLVMPETGPLLLGLVRRIGNPMVVRRTGPNTYEIKAVKVQLDPGRGGVASKPLCAAKDHWKRLVDGAWQHGCLWLLTTEGAILRAYPADTATPVPLMLDLQHHTIQRPGRAAPRAIDACSAGLSVLAGNGVTFLRFRLREGGPDKGLAVDEGKGRWMEVRDALDCALFWAHDTGQTTDLLENIVHRNPIWTVVASGEPGLTWIGWVDSPISEGGAKEALNDDPWRAPGRSGSTGGNVMYVRFARLGTPGVGVLAVATRDHKLQIASVLDRQACDRSLKALALAEPQPNQSPALQWWTVSRTLREDFSTEQRAPAQAAGPALDALKALECAGEDNLRVLAARLVMCWREALSRFHKPEPHDAPKLLELNALVKDWTLRLLRRAYDIRPDLAREIAKMVYDRLSARRRRSSKKIKDIELPSAVDEDIGLFAIFLRKWVIRGHTYDEKQFGVMDLYASNIRCGRTLDALAFLTKLLRQRVDALWEADPLHDGAGSPMWDLAVAANGSFSVQSYTDGSICAVWSDGRLARWTVGNGVTVPKPLAIFDRGRGLRHAQADRFTEEYRHGPFARRLLLLPHPGGGDRYVLLFSFKGWLDEKADPAAQGGTKDAPPASAPVPAHLMPKRTPEKDAPPASTRHRPRSPLLCAIVFAPARDPAAPAGGPLLLEIRAADALAVYDDLYGMCALPALRNGEKWEQRVLAGTRGSWTLEGQPSPSDTPFVEALLSVDADGPVHIAVRPTPVRSSKRGQRSAVSRIQQHNPCWAIVMTPGPARPTVWAGFKDGHIRRYQRDGSPGAWLEQAGNAADVPGPEESGFTTSGAVWNLCAFTVPAEHGGKHRLLAYGTANGTVGAVDLDEMDKAAKLELGSRRAASPLHLARHAQAVTRRVRHLVHSRQTEPICALVPYADTGDVVKRKTFGTDGVEVTEDSIVRRERLMAVSESGVVMLFDVDFLAFGEVVTTAGTGATAATYPARPSFPGMRVDRFRLTHPARAAALVRTPDGRAPEILVGSNRGQLRLYTLDFPRDAQRREHAVAERFHGLEQPGVPSELTDAVGTARHHEWLRVLDVGNDTLLRYAMWEELERQLQSALPQAAGDRSGVDAFRETLKRLADEIHRRRPFSKEPVKILWQQGAKLANTLAERAVTGLGPRRQYLADCRGLKLALDDLCNRWLGFEQTIEAKVLTHNFNEMFHWTDIVIIASGNSAEAGDEEDKLRDFLLRKLISRRLMYPDPMVPLETLRVINAAMLRTLAHDRGRWTFHPTHGKAGTDHACFFELMRMVGDLERVHEAVPPTDPLSTEVSTFFALCLLLLPKSQLIVAQVGSESNLAAHGRERTDAIVAHARSLAKLLRLPDGPTSELACGLRLFEADFAEADLSVLRYRKGASQGQGSAWQILIDAAPTEETNEPFSDRAFSYEQQHVLRAAAWLSDLGDPPEDEWSWDRGFAALEKCHTHFPHSFEYLKRLRARRTAVCNALRADRDALIECDAAQFELLRADLFEPQLSHYQRVILRWREQIYDRGRKAADALAIFDEFNRHVYRTSADNLMTSVVELAMQAAPVSFADRVFRDNLATTTLRRLVSEGLDPESILRELLERADRLVDNTHTAATLMQVVSEYLGTPQTASLPHAGVSGREARAEIDAAVIRVLGVSTIAERARIVGGDSKGKPQDVAWNRRPDDRAVLPGTLALWSFIAHEAVTNNYRHGWRHGDRSTPPGLHLWYGKTSGERLGIRLGGTTPFWETLDPQAQDAIAPRGADPAQKAVAVEAYLPKLFERRVKLHADRFGSTGMGLTLVEKVAKIAGMEARLLLWDPSYATDEPRPEDKLGFPLWLEISWSRPPTMSSSSNKEVRHGQL
jgi:hypothetical protein